MLLDRIDIDNHGPLCRVELGPFSEHLNVVCGPEGSGKTAIVRFVRDSLIRRQYPLGMMNSSTGRVVWADRNGKVHCRREKDGTPDGRCTIEFESRGDSQFVYDALRDSWLHGASQSSDAHRALQSLQMPECLVDGILTDTAVSNVARVVASCLQLDLDDPNLFQHLPLGDSFHKDSDTRRSFDHGLDLSGKDAAERRKLRDELARVESELAQLPSGISRDSRKGILRDPDEYDRLIARRNELSTRLATRREPDIGARQYVDGEYSVDTFEKSRLTQRLEQLHDRIWKLRAQQNELRRWMDHLEADRRQFANGESAWHSPHNTRPSYRDSYDVIESARLDARLRDQLYEIDAQLLRWRRILTEIRGLRDTTLSHLGRAYDHSAAYTDPLDIQSARRSRLNHFIEALDRHGNRSNWDEFYRGSTYANWQEEIDSRIESASRQLDALADQYAQSYASTNPYWPTGWYQGAGRHDRYDSYPSLSESLRAIRTDLENARRAGFRYADSDVYRAETVVAATAERSRQRYDAELYDLSQCERWLVASIEQLMNHRESLLREHNIADLLRYPSWIEGPVANTRHFENSTHRRWYSLHLQAEQADRDAECRRLTAEIENCLSEAAQIRHRMRSLPIVEQWSTRESKIDWMDREAILSEIREIDRSLSGLSRWRWLQHRRKTLMEMLGSSPVSVISRGQSPLSDEAGQWLVRLSAGRLRSIQWDCELTPIHRQVGQTDREHGTVHRVAVLIDGQIETQCSSVDRALAALAVRMAAVDLLARTQRHLPLVVETHRELLHQETVSPVRDDHLPGSLRNHSVDRQGNLAIVTALQDYAARGRQIVLLTSDPSLAHQVDRSGGRVFFLQGERVAHPHRPVWSPHFSTETYVGPYAHTYGNTVASTFGTPEYPTTVLPVGGKAGFVDNYHDRTVYQSDPPTSRPSGFYKQPLSKGFAGSDVNRNFDLAWQEAYGTGEFNEPVSFLRPTSDNAMPGYAGYSSSQPSGYPNAHPHWVDGYYYADTFTTSPANASTSAAQTPSQASRVAARELAMTHVKKPASPFFLSVDSSIDQAPSIDAVAAARLRGLNVTHINHLMQQDPNRLADALGLANVDAATIRRWQSECRLVCHVPHLRGFDARVLVGCGIADPAHLASTDPVELLERVESFLATEQGQRILLSGTSYELSRITSWIAAANRNALDPDAVRYYDTRTIDGRVVKARGLVGEYDSDRYEYSLDADGNPVIYDKDGRLRSPYGIGASARRAQRRAARRSRTRSGNGQGFAGGYGIASGDGDGFASGERSGNGYGTSNGFASGSGQGQRVSRSGRGSGSGSGSGSGNGSGNGYGTGSGYGSGRGSRRRSAARANSDYVRLPRERENTSREYERPEYERAEYERAEYERAERESRPSRSSRSERKQRKLRKSRPERTERAERRERASGDSERELRFYLDRSSPIVDAPSIGARMAARLEAVGIHTVDDLVSADADVLASELDHRRIDADVIVAWQHQATLVCRIPMLRGHDAQLLVAAEVTTAEEVAAFEPSDLLELIDPVARSNEGKRILRGGKLPDLEEITEWISYAGQNRELVAA